jgi:hypothetical protein
MKIFYCVFALCLLSFAGAFAQTDTNTYMVKYSHDFKFSDGIYMSFDEFKNNAPSIKKFEVYKDKNNADESYIILKSTKTDSLGETTNMVVQNCYGFSKNGVLYFSNGIYGFNRLFIMGALSLLLDDLQTKVNLDEIYADPSTLNILPTEISEMFLDLETGEIFLFGYRNFKIS